jgi:hypothetical protein
MSVTCTFVQRKEAAKKQQADLDAKEKKKMQLIQIRNAG